MIPRNASLIRLSTLRSSYAGERIFYPCSALKGIAASAAAPIEVVMVLDGPISNDLKVVVDVFGIRLSPKLVPLFQNVSVGGPLSAKTPGLLAWGKSPIERATSPLRNSNSWTPHARAGQYLMELC